MIYPDMREQLENWAKWVRIYPHRSHCRSIEHRYRPSGEEAQESRRNPKIPVNELDAVEIERIISGSTFPKREKQLLRVHYVFYWVDRRKTCRELAIPFSDYDLRLRMAELMVWNRIE